MAKKAIERRLPSATAPIQKKKKHGRKHLSAQAKLAARKAYKQYKKRRNTADKKFDLVRAQFRAKKRKGFKNKPGPKLKVAAKVGTINRKAGALRSKLKKTGKLGKKEAAALKGLKSSAKKKYSANRKRIQAVAKQKAHDIVGNAMVEANKMIAEAKKSGNKKAMAAANKKAAKLLTVAKNKAVQTIQDTRRDLTSMRKAAGRNKGGRKRGPKAKVAVGGKAGSTKHSLDMGIRPNRAVRRFITGRANQIRNAKAAAASAGKKFNMGARPNRAVRRQITGRNMQIRKAKANRAMSGVGHSVSAFKKKPSNFGKHARAFGKGFAGGAAVGAAAGGAHLGYQKYKNRKDAQSA